MGFLRYLKNKKHVIITIFNIYADIFQSFYMCNYFIQSSQQSYEVKTIISILQVTRIEAEMLTNLSKVAELIKWQV